MMMQPAETIAEARETVYRQDGHGYPGGALVEMELRPGYDRTKKNMLFHMKAVNEAHLIMLVRQKIVSMENGRTMMKALESLDYEKYVHHEYTGEYEDLFFEIENEIIQMTKGIGGNLHLGRSRNDMCLCLSHMVIRKDLLGLINEALMLQNTIRLFAEEHKDTLYVAHTHTQHAQPSFLGHYFLGAFDVLDRDIKRLMSAYAKVNMSTMGAAAITTSGFPLDRKMVSDLLGFDGFIFNSYDAIGNADFYTETAAAIGLAAVNLGRIVTDLILWATEELHMIRVADGYISTSSIMPQKRNPIALEHLRSSLSIVKGLADAVQLSFMKTPYGDISDYEDAEEPIARATDLLKTNYHMLNAVIATLTVDKKTLERRAYESFSVVTEMADEMYRSYNIPFRQAHHIVAILVKKAQKAEINLKKITPDFFASVYKEVTGNDFLYDFSAISRSLDPLHFVVSRDVTGGTSLRAMNEMIVRSKKKETENIAWHHAKEMQLSVAEEERREAIKKILGIADM